MREHISHCLEHAIISGNAAEQRRKVTELSCSQPNRALIGGNEWPLASCFTVRHGIGYGAELLV